MAHTRTDQVPGSRVIGMLGGMSWESSAEYYRLLNEVVRDRLGGLHSARCVLASVDFAVIEELQVAGRWDEAGELLAQEAVRLEAAGADLLVLCTNTMHKVADRIQAAIGIPLLHIADVTAQAVIAAGLRHRRPAGHGLHHGAGLLPRPAGQPWPDRAGPRRRRTAPRCTGSSTTNSASGIVRDDHASVYQGVIGRLVAAGARESSWAAPRSSC